MAAIKTSSDKGGTKTPVTPRAKSAGKSPAVRTEGRRGAARAKRPAAPQVPHGITPEQHHHMIAEAAYYRAERRGFQCRCSEQDWFDAAAEIDRILKRR